MSARCKPRVWKSRDNIGAWYVACAACGISQSTYGPLVRDGLLIANAYGPYAHLRWTHAMDTAMEHVARDPERWGC